MAKSLKRAATAELVRETGLPVTGHLTCVDATRDDVDGVALTCWSHGIRHIAALRGDPAVPRSRRRSPHRAARAIRRSKPWCTRVKALCARFPIYK